MASKDTSHSQNKIVVIDEPAVAITQVDEAKTENL